MTNKVSQGNPKLKQYLEDLGKNRQFREDLSNLSELSGKDRQKHEIYISERYGLDVEMLFRVIDYIKDNKLIWGEAPDVCRVYDVWDEELNEVFPYIATKDSVLKTMEVNAYPVAIRLHKLTTKRDLLDYVKKNWWQIEDVLEAHRTKPRRRKRHKQKVYDFIFNKYENEKGNNKAKKIKTLLDEVFPDHGMVYHEIDKAYRVEKTRRNTPIDLRNLS